MDEFRTVAKIWPTGVDLDLGTDSNILGGPGTFTRNASNWVTSPDGTTNYQFLFWNTGRHLTNKTHVRWIFSVLGWGVWTATRWYGIPSGNGGPPRVRADAFSIGTNAVLAPTPISAASTFAAGAWPFSGDDHAVGTAAGPATIVPVDPLLGYEFAGFMQLLWGGDPVGEFVETDAGSGGSIGGPGFYDHVVGSTFAAAQNTSADLLAAYGYNDSGLGPFRFWLDLFRQRKPFDIPDRGDPAPPDILRARILEQLLRQTQPAPRGGEFEELLASAPSMTKEQVQRAMQSVKTSLDLGKTTLDALEAQAKRLGKGK
jgi:hypothetical protein